MAQQGPTRIKKDKEHRRHASIMGLFEEFVESPAVPPHPPEPKNPPIQRSNSFIENSPAPAPTASSTTANEHKGSFLQSVASLRLSKKDSRQDKSIFRRSLQFFLKDEKETDPKSEAKTEPVMHALDELLENSLQEKRSPRDKLEAKRGPGVQLSYSSPTAVPFDHIQHELKIRAERENAEKAKAQKEKNRLESKKHAIKEKHHHSKHHKNKSETRPRRGSVIEANPTPVLKPPAPPPSEAQLEAAFGALTVSTPPHSTPGYKLVQRTASVRELVPITSAENPSPATAESTSSSKSKPGL